MGPKEFMEGIDAHVRTFLKEMLGYENPPAEVGEHKPEALREMSREGLPDAVAIMADGTEVTNLAFNGVSRQEGLERWISKGWVPVSVKSKHGTFSGLLMRKGDRNFISAISTGGQVKFE